MTVSSQHFEKKGNQNYLRNNDVDRIVSTYRERTTQDKYSYIAPLEEVKENDYNLNIPRYVDTFKVEDRIDLALIANELKSLEANIQETDKTIADYCKQLNISTPF